MTIPKKKILFIINPISGGHNKIEIIQSIPKLLDNHKFDISFAHTKHFGHATKIAKNAVDENIDIVVAVGGDGTINEIASQLVNTNTTLAIVPCGSGNGLARDLNIPLHYKKAIQQINTLKIKKIDVGICNRQYFISLTGTGFDAKVAYDFNRGKKRKFLGYAWSILKDYFNVKDQYYEIELENEKITGKYFFVTIANCSQWGYNVKVAPDAKLDDGFFSINLCRKPSFFSLIPFGIKMLSGNIGASNYVVMKSSSKITLTSNHKFFYHLDGDAKGIARQIEVEILHEALRVIVK
ncbi:MAG: diacylglycerol kinase family lipid kinase [Bacteroidetes bacterium]|nr:diacylglycerol kinase family lipid kinase [Bacteroidota bacterium]MCL1969047.1 diacylglycerol kinase family lipid kinase [Bacteroidota bacterium]